MTRFVSDLDKNEHSRFAAILWYGVAIVLLIVFINTFELWRLLVANTGPAVAGLLPFLITALAVASIFHFARRNVEWRPLFVILGLTVAGTALLLTDPEFPAKRIHVPQYMLLAIVLRRALLCSAIGEPMLSIYGVAMAILLGIHDEILQGFHPDRSFGIRDIGINALGALSGVLLARGCRFFESATNSPSLGDGPTAISIAAIVVAAAMLVAPLGGFRGLTIPYWTVMPLLAAACLQSLLTLRHAGRSALPHRVYACLGYSLLPYPLVSHAVYFH